MLDSIRAAEAILLSSADKELKKTVYEICKLQLAVYNGFIELGCRP